MRSVTTSIALANQPVDDGADGLLVAGDGARGEDHAIALRERHLGVVVLGDAGQRGARLALAARQHRDDLVARHVAVAFGAEEIGGCRREGRARAPPGRRAPWPGRPRRRSRPLAIAASATERIRPTLEAKVVTATRAALLAISSARLFATSRSEGDDLRGSHWWNRRSARARLRRRAPSDVSHP